jgi:hypothetical protein
MCTYNVYTQHQIQSAGDNRKYTMKIVEMKLQK